MEVITPYPEALSYVFKVPGDPMHLLVATFQNLSSLRTTSSSAEPGFCLDSGSVSWHPGDQVLDSREAF